MVDAVGDRTLNDLLNERARMHPGRPAFTVEAADGTTEHRTYGEFRDEVLALSAGLARLGIRKGDTVLLHLPNCVEIVIGWFALARLGAIMVPSNPQHTVREIAYIAETSGVRAAIARPEHLDDVRRATGLPLDVLIATSDASPGSPIYTDLLVQGADEASIPISSEDVVEMIFTSGTTAAPKGVLLTHANCLRSGEQIAKSLALTPQDRCLTSLPVFHVNAQSSTILSAMSVGAPFVILEQYSASRFVGQLAKHEATITSLVGTQVRTLLLQEPNDQDAAHKVRHVFYAINVSDAEFDEFEHRFGMRLLNGYGLSEAMMAVTIAPIHGERRWPSVGLPLIDREVRIVGEEGQLCSAGQIGEITVRGIPGRSLMKGYHKNPQATRDAIRDGWLYTGDSGYTDEQGYIHFVDRKKDMIKRSGENVSAREIEGVLLEHPNIVEAAVLGVPDAVRDEAIVAYVALSAPLSSEDILTYCRANLAPFKVPSFIEVMDRLPKTSIGKIEKKALRSRLEDLSQRGMSS